MPYKVTWQTLPERKVLRTGTFLDLDDARAETQLYLLSIPGKAEAVIDDERGRRVDIYVHDNSGA